MPPPTSWPRSGVRPFRPFALTCGNAQTIGLWLTSMLSEWNHTDRKVPGELNVTLLIVAAAVVLLAIPRRISPGSPPAP